MTRPVRFWFLLSNTFDRVTLANRIPGLLQGIAKGACDYAQSEPDRPLWVISKHSHKMKKITVEVSRHYWRTMQHLVNLTKATPEQITWIALRAVLSNVKDNELIEAIREEVSK